MKQFVSGLAVVVLLGAGQVHGEVILSTFDTDDEGWRVAGDAAGAVPNWAASGGNPDGYVFAVDRVVGGVWYWVAPGKFLGNVSAAYNRTLTFDLKQSGTHSQFNASDVFLTGAGTTLAFDMPHPGTDWTSYSIPLNEAAGWGTGNENGPPPTQGQMLAVLSSLTALRIRGEFITGSDTGSLDNVILTVPEPSTLALLILCALGVCARQRRKRQGISGSGR